MAKGQGVQLFKQLISFQILLTWLCLRIDGAIYDLYNTKIATSDLKWTTEPRNSWEEVSGFDRFNSIIRYYQVCHLGEGVKNNWLRSPFIPTKGAQRINVEIEFSIGKCGWPGMDNDYCRQTFNLFYYESDRDVASSTFPPWQERPYIKVDTVAANSQDEINKKTFTLGPLKSVDGGIYIAAQDQGACMSLISLRVYYYYCPETTHSLATFGMTMTGEKTASLVTVPGTCVANAQTAQASVPKYYCGSTGEWQIITGSCLCKAGFQPNAGATMCKACPPGTFKTTVGNSKCSICPANSGQDGEIAPRTNWPGFASLVKTGTPGHIACPCHLGYARAKGEGSEMPCTKIPSAPVPGPVKTNSTSIELSWSAPLDLGGRLDHYYSIACEYCPASGTGPCRKCPESVSYMAPSHSNDPAKILISSVAKIYRKKIIVANLEPFTRYLFKVFSHNGVSDSSNEQPNYFTTEIITDESVPPPIANIYVADFSLHSVAIKWQEPASPRGKILEYEVEVRKRDSVSRSTRASIRTPPLDKANQTPLIVKTDRTSVTLDDLDPDTEYLVRIRARTSVGFGKYSSAVMFRTAKRGAVDVGETENDNGTGFLIGAVSAVLFLAVGCSVLVFVYSRRRSHTLAAEKKKPSSSSIKSNRYDEVSERKNKMAMLRNRNSDPKDQKTYVDYPDPGRAVQGMKMEVSPTNLRLHNTIGEGEFAVVYKGTMINGAEPKTVAVKQLKDGATVKDQANFLREACTMVQFEHPNILQLKGVITKHKPVMIISEHLENGSLDRFLKLHRGQLNMPQLLQMLRGIANGMRYLSDMKYVHRDLAARNILVNSDLTCKVSDFGLSRTLENDPYATYTTQGGKIALRWTAPECIRFRQFTSASDVWSYGILMWEVMSYGEKPYWDMTNEEVIQSIGSGMRLPAPTNCPKALHELMLECWSLDPKKRPSFVKIVSDLNRFIRHSSLLQVRSNDVMEQSVCCSPDIRHASCPDQEVEEIFFARSRMSDEDDLESESSSLSEEDTCSSVVVTDERCLNV